MVWFAALLSLAWLFVHLIMGEREIARPLRTRSALKKVEWSTAFLCWHLVSGLLLCMALFFALGGLWGDTGLVLAATILALMCSLVGIALPRFIGVSYKVLPQGWMFLPVVIAGVLAL